ncbi:MAG: hypothetical protein IJN60_04320 [Oscillospiraceae bacterium]|nr:hypothetical protein [Oscillospiraceae bacterium]
MKRAVAILVLIVMLLSMTACESGTTQPSAKEIKLGEKITVGEKAFTITKFEWKEELLVGKKWSADRGNVFGRIKISFYNEGRKEMNLSVKCHMNYDNGYEIVSFFGENGYFNTSYPIDMELASGSSYDLNFAAAEVSEYAKTDTDSPLWIEIEFEGEQYIYYIRK